MAGATANVRSRWGSIARPGAANAESVSAAVVALWSRCACLLFACAFGLVSCATVDATTTQYVGAPHSAPSDPAKVQILRVEPKAAHDRLGEIVVDASTDPAPPIAEVEDKLRAEGGKLGADAVVVVLDRIQPVGVYVSGPWWGASVQPITGRKLVGVAIKYRP